MSTSFTDRPEKPTLFLTTDYELYLGSKTGDPNHCMIEPMQKMAQVAESFGKSWILFVDVPYLQRLNQMASDHAELQVQQASIYQQLQNLLKRGHGVELHFHPQWLKAMYANGSWSFPEPIQYKLHDLEKGANSNDWHTIQGCITQGHLFLERLAQEVLPDYTLKAFRAGGFCVQPFQLLHDALSQNNILVDSTVAPGLYANDGLRAFDFRQCPTKDAWSFEEDPCSAKSGGSFTEMPIATFVPNLGDHLCARWERRQMGHRFPLQPWGNGIGLPTPKAPFLKRLIGTPTLLTYDYWDAKTIIRECQKKFKNGHQVVTLLGHPKFLSPFGLEQIRLVLEAAKAEGWE